MITTFGTLSVLFVLAWPRLVPDGQGSRAAAAAIADLRANASSLGLETADLDDVTVSSELVSESMGVTHVYLRQRHEGIDIWGADMTVNVARDGRIVGREGNFVAGTARAPRHDRPALDAAAAARAAARHAHLTFTEPLRGVRAEAGPSREAALSGGGVAAGDIPVRLVFFPVARALRLAWHVEIEERSAEHWWVLLIDADTGALLEKRDRVVTKGNLVPLPLVTPREGARFTEVQCPHPETS